MLAELLKKGYGKTMNLNCAEKMLHGGNWAYNLGLAPEALKLSAGFGGGMGCGNTCGVVTGAVMVIGALCVKRNAKEEGTKVRELAIEFVKRMQEELGSEQCKYLKDKYHDDVNGCDIVIFKGAEILDDIVKREGLR